MVSTGHDSQEIVFASVCLHLSSLPFHINATPPRRALVVAMDGVNAQKSLTRINYIDNALESKGIDRSFARWFQGARIINAICKSNRCTLV